MKIKDIRISDDGTHHLWNQRPLYPKRYILVQSFHTPGLASVEDETGSFFIDLEGNDVFEKRFVKSYGFYDGVAAVCDDSGWYHIDVNGNPIYQDRFEWVGNFQEGFCAVKSLSGRYHHIVSEGSPLYERRYRYVGDFKYGKAVVYDDDGTSFFIDSEGSEILKSNNLENQPYHKGYAVSRDSKGYHHTDVNGRPIYSQRYLMAEPFYNGRSLVQRKDMRLAIIDESGVEIHEVTPKGAKAYLEPDRQQIMGMLVGYWQTQIMSSIVRSGVLDVIADGVTSEEDIRSIVNLPERSTDMIIEMCLVWGLIKRGKDSLTITDRGGLLLEGNLGSLHHAAKMWSEEHYLTMSSLWDALKTQKPQFERHFGIDHFKHINKDSSRSGTYNSALSEYAIDYAGIVSELDLDNARTVVDLGGGTGSLSRALLDKTPSIERIYLYDLEPVVSQTHGSDNLQDSRIIPFAGNFFSDEIPHCDHIIASRVVHDWDDDSAIALLKNSARSLSNDGRIILLEMVKPDRPDVDLGVSLNFNLLVMTGGKERTVEEFRHIGESAGLFLEMIIEGQNIISAIIFIKTKEVSDVS